MNDTQDRELIWSRVPECLYCRALFDVDWSDDLTMESAGDHVPVTCPECGKISMVLISVEFWGLSLTSREVADAHH